MARNMNRIIVVKTFDDRNHQNSIGLELMIHPYLLRHRYAML